MTSAPTYYAFVLKEKPSLCIYLTPGSLHLS